MALKTVFSQNSVAFTLSLAAVLWLSTPVHAGDWGYDDAPGKSAKAAPGNSDEVIPMRATPQSRAGSASQSSKARNSGSLFARTPQSGGASGINAAAGARSRIPQRGAIVPRGPFDVVETGVGNYGVQLNPAEYESAGGSPQHNYDDDDPHHGRVPPSGIFTTAPGVPKAPRTVTGNTSKAATKASPSLSKLNKSADTQALATECWQQIFTVAGNSNLSDDQKASLQSLVAARLCGDAQAVKEVKAPLLFWPKVTEYLAAHPEQKENYSSLLRALLRWRERMQKQDLGDDKLKKFAQQENDLIAEVLGPARIAVDDETPFTEDAVNAYSDMACFVYEQRNPGKTLDGADNRAMFANVVCEKFRLAPTEKDKAAMAGFDLSWAKFKVVWQESGEADRATLLQTLAGRGAAVAWAKVKDPVLESLLSQWPAPKSAPPVEPMLAKAQTYASVKKDPDSTAKRPANAGIQAHTPGNKSRSGAK